MDRCCRNFDENLVGSWLRDRPPLDPQSIDTRIGIQDNRSHSSRNIFFHDGFSKDSFLMSVDFPAPECPANATTNAFIRYPFPDKKTTSCPALQEVAQPGTRRMFVTSQLLSGILHFD